MYKHKEVYSYPVFSSTVFLHLHKTMYTIHNMYMESIMWLQILRLRILKFDTFRLPKCRRIVSMKSSGGGGGGGCF
jgi:hypothetical protein